MSGRSHTRSFGAGDAAERRTGPPRSEISRADDDYNSTLLHRETHCGTHMDAPTHFLSKDDYRTIDEITVDEMVTEGVICDFTHKEPGSGISREELAEQADRYDLSGGDYLIVDRGMAPADTDRYLRNFVYPEEGAAEFMNGTSRASRSTHCRPINRAPNSRTTTSTTRSSRRTS
jgi:kynurenine formamidase